MILGREANTHAQFDAGQARAETYDCVEVCYEVACPRKGRSA